MTNTGTPGGIDPTELFTTLVARVEARAEEMAETIEMDVKHGDWQDGQRGMDLAALYRRAKAWRGQSTDRLRPYVLVCSVEGPDDHVWGHAASDILDAVSQDLPRDVLDRPTGPTEVCIEELAPGRYGLFW